MTDYAIIKKGLHQYFLVKGKYIDIPRVKEEKAQKVVFSDVLLTSVGEKLEIGQPTVEKATVTCTVVKHFKGEKGHGQKFKAKSRYRKHWGFRHQMSRLMVDSIDIA